MPPLAASAASDAQVELGRQLFMDRRLSRNGTMACAMCHSPEQGFAAVELGTSVGIEGRSLRRNASTLLNAAYAARLFHDVRSTSLGQQAWEPLLNPIELGDPDTAGVISRIAALPEYGGKFEAAFGGAAASRETAAAALAAYQRTLVSADSRFEVSGNGADRWAYRTPGLRNVALTAPYMHDGSLATLEEVIALYQRGGIEHRPSRRCCNRSPWRTRKRAAWPHSCVR